jgi:hypothetical protein
MSKRIVKEETKATPPSKAAYQSYACPNDCGRIEKAGKTPFYSSCPQCFKPAGAFVPVKAKKGK